MQTFKDHFSGHSADYQRYRPHYPDELFRFLAESSREHNTAWDAGTGNGQGAVRLADYFTDVLATDPSANQIADAIPHPRVTYHVSRAEQCPAASHSLDLITVAQALHWFDFDAFFSEAQRVIKPGGLLAAWTYGLAQVDEEVDRVVHEFYRTEIDAYWPPERRFVEEKYSTITFPFEEIDCPKLQTTMAYTLDDYMGYLNTWSAVKKYQAAKGRNPLTTIEKAMHKAWGSPGDVKTVWWPIYMRAGIL